MTISTESKTASGSDRLFVSQAQQNGSGPKTIVNTAAKGVSFFTPEQDIRPGTAVQNQDRPTPKLFTPLKIRGIEMPNRIWVSPMCQYSSHEGFQGPWHTTHYGGIAQRGVSEHFKTAQDKNTHANRCRPAS